ncbi:site-specific integrase [Bacillus paralicheniformis]|uniref:site-specific integrase n=1 Tax=Bacillus paralicheniformis TaxID=1648923 RepID=UPI0023F2C7E0|nr:site-specific integrase [Bacillus paralicheniformis]MEC1451629.1 site-specific integrase [Bacillus haynesii]
MLLSLLDLTDFVQLRDATALLLMYKTGMCVGMLANLKEEHIDFNEALLRLSGEIVKNREPLLLPFDETLAQLLSVLVNKNDEIRRTYKKDNKSVNKVRQSNSNRAVE